MKDLLVDETGDFVISKHDLQFVRDKELTIQKVRLTLSTNKGEWLLNQESGINFRAILVKNPNKDEILDTVRDGLHQIDESFVITEYEFETIKRRLILTFKAVNESGEEISLAISNAKGTNQNGETVDVLVCGLTADEVITAGDAITTLCICDTDDTVLCGTLQQ